MILEAIYDTESVYPTAVTVGIVNGILSVRIGQVWEGGGRKFSIMTLEPTGVFVRNCEDKATGHKYKLTSRMKYSTLAKYRKVN